MFNATETEIVITDALEVGNPEQLIELLTTVSIEHTVGMFVRVDKRVDTVGTHELRLVDALDEEQPKANDWVLLGTVDYWAMLWEQAQATQARLAATGDPDDIHDDGCALYWTLENLADGAS